MHHLAELIQVQVPLVPQLQGVVPVEGCGADLLVEVPDVGEQQVGLLDGLGELLLLAVVDALERLGRLLEEGGQGLRLAPDLPVELLGAHVLVQLLQSRDEVFQAGLNDAVALVLFGALVHLV